LTRKFLQIETDMLWTNLSYLNSDKDYHAIAEIVTPQFAVFMSSNDQTQKPRDHKFKNIKQVRATFWCRLDTIIKLNE